MAYSIRISPAAERALKRLDPPVLRRIAKAIDGLQAEPRPAGVKKLAGSPGLWRIRVGDYRILYQILDKVLLIVIVIVTVGHRGDLYRE